MISPLLFCTYMDELLKRLETERVGCWIGQHYYGGVGYADDLILAVPSVRALRQMVKICKEFGEEYRCWKIVDMSDIQLCSSTLK